VFSSWLSFLNDQNLSAPEPIQWEVSYNNRIPAGELWTSLDDVRDVFRGAMVLPAIHDGGIESATASYHYRLADNKGRLHVSIHHVVAASDQPQWLQVQLTARGPTLLQPDSSEKPSAAMIRAAVEAGLDIGRLAIVRSFKAMTSEKAHAFWRLVPPGQEMTDE
jgi:hypothetical protein